LKFWKKAIERKDKRREASGENKNRVETKYEKFLMEDASPNPKHVR
jgi:hypothetical protein